MKKSLVAVFSAFALCAGAETLTTVNIINFVRGAEPRNPALDLVEPLRCEVELNTKYGFPNTILFQYDALLRDDLLAAARSAQTDRTEMGLWFEVVDNIFDFWKCKQYFIY